MTTASPSHHPLLPPTRVPPWGQELPGTAAVTGTGLQGLGGYHRLPRTFLQVSPLPLPTAPPSPATPSYTQPSVFLGWCWHTPKSVSVWLWHALLIYLCAYVYLLVYMYPCGRSSFQTMLGSAAIK